MGDNRNRPTVIIALLDKAWPPSHSFVDGMLATEAAREPDLKVRLCVSRSGQIGSPPNRYKRAACLPALFPRRGIKRFLNLFVAWLLIRYQAQRERRRGHRVVLFVRNDPVYLLAASMLHKRVDRVVFQSSFPHEEFSNQLVKRRVARLLYRLAGGGVDAVTGVSPEGTARANRLCPRAERGPHIPLLADMPTVALRQGRTNGMRFLYVGTHEEERELETVLMAIVEACNALSPGAAEFLFVGGSQKDIARLSMIPGVPELVNIGTVAFLPAVPRTEIPELMASASVGISLIPPKPVYFESSPTKLAEYMGAGLAVLASYGIPMQERFISESGGGMLTDWNISAIAEAIQKMIQSPEDVQGSQVKAREFADHALKYHSYLDQFRQLVSV